MILVDCIDVCNDVDLLNILSIFKSLIRLATIIVPVILVIFVMIDIIKTISSGDVDTKKLSKSISKRIIAAVIVFLIFPVVNFVLQTLPISNLKYISYYNCADKAMVLQISKNNADNAINNLNSAISTLQSSKTDENYNEALRLYEIARKEVKKITSKSERETYQKNLQQKRTQINNLRPN